jgi:hypothetical protein
MNSNTDFQLLSAMRYDESRPWNSLLSAPLLSDKVDSKSGSNPILLLSYHRDRLANAGDAFGWTEAAEKLRDNTTCEMILSLARNAIEKSRTKDTCIDEQANANDDSEAEAAYKASASEQFKLVVQTFSFILVWLTACYYDGHSYPCM